MLPFARRAGSVMAANRLNDLSPPLSCQSAALVVKDHGRNTGPISARRIDVERYRLAFIQQLEVGFREPVDGVVAAIRDRDRHNDQGRLSVKGGR